MRANRRLDHSISRISVQVAWSSPKPNISVYTSLASNSLPLPLPLSPLHSFYSAAFTLPTVCTTTYHHYIVANSYMLMLHVGIALMAVIVGFQAIASYELPLFLETLESTKHLWRGAPALLSPRQTKGTSIRIFPGLRSLPFQFMLTWFILMTSLSTT